MGRRETEMERENMQEKAREIKFFGRGEVWGERKWYYALISEGQGERMMRSVGRGEARGTAKEDGVIF